MINLFISFVIIAKIISFKSNFIDYFEVSKEQPLCLHYY